ncbi:pimeloyl-ACP methyl ester carboxylesterase [Thermobifida halotolerans]|uniref:alpha/beta fold hydrolase n=1 Tax=Thermobifida halotolerans TaxID=483545 RepID=UPI001B882835|nr:alpha/beta hydrolase [Thermobifida halotolerans]
MFLPGADLVGLDYLTVHDRIRGFTTSVVYDRAGTGWSDPVDLPRTGAEVVDELHGLLHACGVAAPCVFVAHSQGGAYARRFAQRFPDEVAGLVSLEGFHGDWDTHMPPGARQREAERTPEPELTEEVLEQFRGLLTRTYADFPAGVGEILVECHLSPEWLAAGARERNVADLADELRNAGDVPDTPLIVLVGLGFGSGQELLLPPEAPKRLNGGRRALFTAVTEAADHGELRLLGDAAHSTIHVDRPDAVVRDLLDRLRR